MSRGVIDRYLESRLWKRKVLQKRSVSTGMLLDEIERYYLDGKKLKDNPDMARQMENKIRLARNRVNQRWSRLKKQKARWAEMLGIPPQVVDILVDEKLVTTTRDVRKYMRILEITGLKKDIC